jgi:hypothetical protein
MSKLVHFEKLIQEKRKKTPFRDFIKEIGSWEVMNLYKRNGRICRYPDTGRIQVLDDTEYKNASSYYREYDFDKSFFENFQWLMDIFPFEHIFHFENNENSDFADSVFGAKNTYLSFIVGFESENVAYSALCYNNIHNIYNSFLACIHSSNVYMSWGVNESHNVFYSRYITNSANIWFSTNLIGCHECIGCDNLENQKYMINNVAYSTEEYNAKKDEILSDKKSFDTIYAHIKKREGRNFWSENVDGDYIIKSSNIEQGSWLVNIHDSRNVVVANGDKWSRYFYDAFDVGMNSEHFYGVMWAWGLPTGAAHLYSSMQITSSTFIYYSQYMENCHHCFGCIGLKNKSYCILNKQYSKEEWESLAEKIFETMEADGSLGKFFPANMNPFYFNDTVAYLVDDSFTKEEVEKEGFLWRDSPIKVDIPEWLEVIKTSELGKFEWFRTVSVIARNEAIQESDALDRHTPFHSVRDDENTIQEWYIDPSILDKVITDEKGNYYRIIKMEYDFLMKHGLPLPRTHWLDRIKNWYNE